ncbi:LOW QUALITY PROTEIN: armadillo repeat-containing protein 4-like [Limulus polyphemus]|uniref:LOW QUALITY PROTEIN: armadillo repeat-containing protein 4-like n=1 Tax=Limulus polyphemus TaxID=6850 RepID=A0ABM1SGW3_LIMPO|nr:LOW QUALITY PROTEIN: armadillo repeat-containing protein 4-like [Limulus polyphemus]
MGQTLIRAAKWTSAREGDRGRLEFSPQNETILNLISQMVETFNTEFPQESMVVFQSPLIWFTNLCPSDFPDVDYVKTETTVESETRGRQASAPLLQLSLTTANKYTLKVSSFEYLSYVMKLAGHNKIKETRACLEANPDPVAKILGDAFATVEKAEDKGLLRYVDMVIKEEADRKLKLMETEKEEKKSPQGNLVSAGLNSASLRLFMLLQQLDITLMKETVKQMAGQVRLTPESASKEVALLQSLCGPTKDKHALQSLWYTSEYTSNNGCRAPLWRQVHGDICYVVVKPFDDPPFCVTFTTAGVFQNKGYDITSGSVEYEKDGELYRDLTTLLKEKNLHFSETVNKKDFALNYQIPSTAVVVKFRHEESDKIKIAEKFMNEKDEENQFLLDNPDKRKKDHTSVCKEEKTPSYSQNEARVKKAKNSGKKEKTTSKKNSYQKLKNRSEDHRKISTTNELSSSSGKKGSLSVTSKISSSKTRSISSKSPFPVKEQWSSSDESSSSEDDEDAAEETWKQSNITDLPSEYWQIQKLVKYLKAGNPTATVLALCILRDYDLTQETSQLAIREVGGLDVLLNLLETNEVKCQIGALKILREIAQSPAVRKSIVELDGLKSMVSVLSDPNIQLRSLVAETIAHVARYRRAQNIVRRRGAIPYLIDLLDVPQLVLKSPESELSDYQKLCIKGAQTGALALWSLSHSKRNKKAIRTAGAVPLLGRLLKCQHQAVLIPVVGTLQECASRASYRTAIKAEGMLDDIIHHLSSENVDLQMHCAAAIYKCAEDSSVRELVGRLEGLKPLVKLISNTELRDKRELMSAVTGAIWKCAKSPGNINELKTLGGVELLVDLLHNQPEEVLIKVVGALSCCAEEATCRVTIRKAGGIGPLVTLLTRTNQSLLVNVTKAVGACAVDHEGMSIIDSLDGVRLLWSQLKSSSPEVQASAAWGLCPCIQNTKDAGEMVRSFVGGLELIVSLLKSQHKEVLSGVCAAISCIAQDEENLAVITDHGVVPVLAQLAYTNDSKLRRYLAEAICRCCAWGSNRADFGDAGVVAPLVSYLKSNKEQVRQAAICALHQLSYEPSNCVTMHATNAVPHLLRLLGSVNEVIQEAAAGCLGNIRQLAMASETS